MSSGLTPFQGFMNYLSRPRRGCHMLKLRSLSGYSLVNAPGSMEPKRADRIACERTYGPAPSSGEPEVIHLCSKNACVNPLHLRWGAADETIQVNEIEEVA